MMIQLLISYVHLPRSGASFFLPLSLDLLLALTLALALGLETLARLLVFWTEPRDDEGGRGRLAPTTDEDEEGDLAVEPRASRFWLAVTPRDDTLLPEFARTRGVAGAAKVRFRESCCTDLLTDDTSSSSKSCPISSAKESRPLPSERSSSDGCAGPSSSPCSSCPCDESSSSSSSQAVTFNHFRKAFATRAEHKRHVMRNVTNDCIDS